MYEPAPAPALHNPEEILCAFDSAWRQGTPRVEDFIAGPAGAPARRELLQELIKIDLEYRWQRAAVRHAAGAPKALLLEEYLQRHPELGPPEQLALDLIGEEYRVRRRWANRPSHAEYQGRFGRHGQRLLDLLRHIDAELADELDGTAIVSAGDAKNFKASVPSATSVVGLVDMLGQCGLLSPAQREELLRGSLERFPDAHALAKELLSRNWLTAYQVNQLLQGRGADLLVGPYQLVERLGAGGAGQVFKARHQKMQRLVALKVLHKDLLTDPEAVGRFGREIQVLSRLDHPNVVHAYDAGPLGETYFLAMEYVEGTDLARLVKQSGPLPVMQACAYIRQAALGLQHAHERGLVHRDIKPHNLIMSLREGRIKVADLGLARLPRAANEEATAALAAVKTGDSLTPVGAAMMGTLDYLAPEQAFDFHKADIRADIYSLGCTLWYLLIGQPPFPVGTLAEKLLSHQSKEPPAIDKLRADVPAGLARVLQRMLAKRPEDRYPTPAAVAEAITPYISTPDARDLEFDPGGWSVRAGAYTTWAMLCKFARRNKAFTATVVTAMVLLAWSSVANYQARRQTERANQNYEKQLKRTLEAVPAIVEAARRAVEQRKIDNALSLVDVALNHDPENSEARLLRGQLLIVEFKFAEAGKELERYLQQRQEDKNASRLRELCGRPRPEEMGNQLTIAHVFQQQEAEAMADALLTRYFKNGGTAFEVRKEQLKLYKKRIDKAWPGLGSKLEMDTRGVYTLDLIRCTQVTSLVPLQDIPLTWLNLAYCSAVKDLEPLRGMPLTTLILESCDAVRDLSPLKGMPLTTLNLSGCSPVRDLMWLKDMPLTELNLAGTGVRDLKPLQGMKLVSLNLSWCGQVVDLKPLEGMPLTALNLSRCEQVRDIKPLEGLPLTTLNLQMTDVSDLSPLRNRNMPLARLELGFCKNMLDLSPLDGMNLTHIELPYKVRGMRVLGRMKSLKTVNIYGVARFSAEEFWKKYKAGDFKQYEFLE